jgi:hypothetical protein
MVDDLYNAIDKHSETGIKSEITNVLKRISQTQGYNVDINCDETFYSLGERHSVKHVKITESDEGFTIRVFNIGDMIRLDYDFQMMLTEEERLREAQAEIEADRRMSLYNSGYRDF